MKCNEVLLFGYLWLSGCNRKTIIRMTGHSSITVTACIGYYRQLVSSCLDDEDQVIGGSGIIVEVDESKFGKRKYNRGHRADGVWVFGGVERTPERRVFVKTVNNRSEQTLLEISSQHVLPGSIIHTDLWCGYTNLEHSMDVHIER